MNSNHYFSKQFDIQSHLVDNNFKMQIQPLMGCMQTVADEHVDSFQMGWKELHQQNFFWVIYRFGLQIFRMPKKYDRITITTWANPPMNVIQPRNFRITDNDGELLIQAHTLWTILDSEKFATHSLQDVMNEKLTSNLVDDDRVEMNLKIPKITLPQDWQAPIHPVLYSDLDYNQHVNNTAYSRWLLDSYPIDFINSHDLKGLIINYTQQARIGDRYAIYTHKETETEHCSLIYNTDTLKEICKLRTTWGRKN